CVLFIVPPAKVPPALRAIDSFAPMICAVLLAWPFVAGLLVSLETIIAGDPIGGLLVLARLWLFTFAFLGVFLMAAPSVYDSLFEIPVLKRSQLSATLHCTFIPLFFAHWYVESKEEIKRRTGMPMISGWWLFLYPYFVWKWSEGVEKATGY